MDINTDAPVITRDEILISAPIQTIWDIQTDVAPWPSWHPDVDGAEADGPLAVGSVFRWQTAGLDIASTVEEIEPPRRIVGAVPRRGLSPFTSGPSTNETAEYWSEPRSRGRAIRSPPSRSRCKPRWTDRCVRGWRTSSGQQKVERVHWGSV